MIRPLVGWYLTGDADLHPSTVFRGLSCTNQRVRAMTFHHRLLAACLLCAFACAAHADDAPWIDEAEDGSARVHLYFFWSLRCPHCLEAIPFIQTLASEYPWLQVHTRELTQSQDGVAPSSRPAPVATSGADLGFGRRAVGCRRAPGGGGYPSCAGFNAPTAHAVIRGKNSEIGRRARQRLCR